MKTLAKKHIVLIMAAAGLLWGYTASIANQHGYTNGWILLMPSYSWLILPFLASYYCVKNVYKSILVNELFLLCAMGMYLLFLDPYSSWYLNVCTNGAVKYWIVTAVVGCINGLASFLAGDPFDELIKQIAKNYLPSLLLGWGILHLIHIPYTDILDIRTYASLMSGLFLYFLFFRRKWAVPKNWITLLIMILLAMALSALYELLLAYTPMPLAL